MARNYASLACAAARLIFAQVWPLGAPAAAAAAAFPRLLAPSPPLTASSPTL